MPYMDGMGMICSSTFVHPVGNPAISQQLPGELMKAAKMRVAEALAAATKAVFSSLFWDRVAMATNRQPGTPEIGTWILDTPTNPIFWMDMHPMYTAYRVIT